MKNKPKEPPKLAIKFANMVFVLGILFCALTAAYATYRIFNPMYVSNLGKRGIETFYIFSMLCGGVFAALFGFGLKRLSNNLKVNLSVLFFSVGIAVCGFETYLEFFKKTRREVIAKQMGVPDDKRTKMEVMNNLRDSGVEAFPNVFPDKFILSNGLTAKKDRIYPLGTISNSTTVFHNEAGYYPIVETDEHGFNNPKGLYIKYKVDIILTGDSFSEGCCVHSNENIGAVLRQLDFNAISVAKGSNGPLIELAALKEYAEPLKPKIVLWLYYVNDLSDLNKELQSSILRKYLNEDDYSQNLISRQKEIDGVLINYVQSKWEKEWERETKRVRFHNSAIKITKLHNLRKRINLTPEPIGPATPIFRDVLQESRQMVKDWGGKMYFIYLPAFNLYTTGNEHLNHDFVMQTVTELDIPIIDIHKEVFDLHPDPLSLFPFRMNSHYNAEGYRLVAEAIGKRLEADGYVPIKSKTN
jgi:hypothetical protein